MITLHMIVKNEEALLPRCLKSIRDFVDEMVIIDTGSTDATCDIIREYGARLERFEWCNDFSAARNYALSFVKTPWTIWLDADDVCLNPHILPKLTSGAHKNGITGLWSMYWQDQLCYQGRLQVFKTKLFKWQGVVHENPMPRRVVFNETAMSDLEVLHLKPAERTHDAAVQYLNILLEKDPENHFGLAESYKFLGRTQEAEDEYYKAYNYPGVNASTRYASLLNCAVLNFELAEKEPQRLEIAMKLCAVAISEQPERAECYSLLGMCNQVIGDNERARECYQTALSKPAPSGNALVYQRYCTTIPEVGLEVLNGSAAA